MTAPKKRHAHVVAESPDGNAVLLLTQDNDGRECMARGIKVKDGQPLPNRGEICQLDAPEGGGCGSLTTLHDCRNGPPSKGPSKAASPAYRRGYDRIRWN